MKTPRPNPADKLRLLAAAFPDGPDQAPHRETAMAFVDDAVAIRAVMLTVEQGDPITETEAGYRIEEAYAKARAEYADALQAVIFAGPEDRFYLVWTDEAPNGLADHVDDAWRNARGKYGANPPIHARPKNTNTNQ